MGDGTIVGAIAQDWRKPAHYISATEDICCFRARLLGNGRPSVFKRRSFAPRSRRPLPGGQLFLMRFAGYGVEKKRLSRTVAIQKTDGIAALGKSKRPRVSGHDPPVMKKRLHNSRFCRAGYNLEVILVFQFSSGLIDAQGWLRQCEANPGRSDCVSSRRSQNKVK